MPMMKSWFFAALMVMATALPALALALGAGAQLMQPLAIAVIGGFTLSGPIVLLLLPGLYRMLDPHGQLAGLAWEETGGTVPND